MNDKMYEEVYAILKEQPYAYVYNFVWYGYDHNFETCGLYSVKDYKSIQGAYRTYDEAFEGFMKDIKESSYFKDFKETSFSLFGIPLGQDDNLNPLKEIKKVRLGLETIECTSTNYKTET